MATVPELREIIPRGPFSLKAAAERMASADGTSLNQFINVAVAEKLSALDTEEFFRSRAAKGKGDAFRAFLDSAGDELPGVGDVVS